MNDKIKIGPVKLSKQGVYLIMKQPELGVKYYIICPKCNKEISVVSHSTKLERVVCSCGAKILYAGKASANTGSESSSKNTNECSETGRTSKDESDYENHDDSTNTIRLGNSQKDLRNGLLQWGRWFSKHTYILKHGNNTIGRKVKGSKCDVLINDPTVSENTANILVREEDQGYAFKLNIIRSTWPVFVNGKEFSDGSSIYLNNGDIIRLGQTNLRFTLK